jgi:hypothetical protein
MPTKKLRKNKCGLFLEILLKRTGSHAGGKKKKRLRRSSGKNELQSPLMSRVPWPPHYRTRIRSWKTCEKGWTNLLCHNITELIFFRKKPTSFTTRTRTHVQTHTSHRECTNTDQSNWLILCTTNGGGYSEGTLMPILRQGHCQSFPEFLCSPKTWPRVPPTVVFHWRLPPDIDHEHLLMYVLAVCCLPKMESKVDAHSVLPPLSAPFRLSLSLHLPRRPFSKEPVVLASRKKTKIEGSGFLCHAKTMMSRSVKPGLTYIK